jgi:hypothetical protein
MSGLSAFSQEEMYPSVSPAAMHVATVKKNLPRRARIDNARG